MKKSVKLFLSVFVIVLLACSLVLTGCAISSEKHVCVVSIEQTGTNGLEDVYTVTYSDGSVSTFTVTNGQDGEDGKDGDDVTIQDVYEPYKQTTNSDEITFSEFLSQYLTFTDETTTLAIQKNLLSVMKIYSEFVVSETYSSIRPGQSYVVSDTALCTGSAVIYDMCASEGGYTYIVTNYHVVYLEEADEALNGASKIARKIYGYLYGSEATPAASVNVSTNTVQKDENGYTKYDYGESAIALEYIGGSVSSDIAVLRAKTSDILAVNPCAAQVELADSYHVGETAIAIGNPEAQGISVTQGIVSVESDYISLNIDGSSRSYRSIRIDTALYSGNSGGGLFNAAGKLIGITNAGNSSDENINYAVPLEIVQGVADNIIYYHEKGSDAQCAYKIVLGITVQTQNSKYVYDAGSGYGKIREEVVLDSVASDSIAESMNLQSGDIITAIIVNDTEYEIARSFDISDLILTLREGDVIQCVVQRNAQTVYSEEYTLSRTALVAIE